jgi:hypothetical protein
MGDVGTRERIASAAQTQFGGKEQLCELVWHWSPGELHCSHHPIGSPLPHTICSRIDILYDMLSVAGNKQETTRTASGRGRTSRLRTNRKEREALSDVLAGTCFIRPRGGRRVRGDERIASAAPSAISPHEADTAFASAHNNESLYDSAGMGDALARLSCHKEGDPRLHLFGGLHWNR